MKFKTNRLLVLSLLLVPGMLIAKPAPKKKKGKPKPPPAEVAPSEDLNGPTPPAPAAPAYTPAYGMAGCGLGSLAIKEDGFVQIFAATLNSTGYQTFGVTSGTSNCKPGPDAVAAEQKVFIEANLVSLKREAVTGQGETLAAFADLLGCPSSQFSQVSKDNFQQIYRGTEADGILQGYKAVLSTQCTRLI